MGLIALRHVGSSWTRTAPVSCIGRWILIHCTTTEVQLQPLEGMFLSGVVYIFLKKKKKTVSQQVKFLRPMCMYVGVAVDVGVGVGVCLCLCVCVGEESQRRESRTQTPRTISL